MAIAYVQSGTASDTNSVSSITSSVNLTGSPNILVVYPGWFSLTSTRAVSSSTYNSVSLTQLSGAKAQCNYYAQYTNTDIWYLKNPATGSAYNLVVTWDAAEQDMGFGWNSWSGVDTTTPFGTPVTANSPLNNTSANPSVTASWSSGEVAIGDCYDNVAITSGNTHSWAYTSAAQNNNYSDGEYSTSTGALTWTAAASEWAATAVNLKPSGGATQGVVYSLSGLNLGPIQKQHRKKYSDGFKLSTWFALEADVKGWFDRSLLVPAAGGVNVTLGGITLGSSQGTISLGADKTLNSQLSSSSQGTVGFGFGVALPTKLISSSQGTLTFALGTTLASELISSSLGTILYGGGDISLALSGQQIGTSQGVLNFAFDKGMVSLLSSSAQGTVTLSFDKALASQLSSSAQGAVSFGLSTTLATQLGSTSQGTVGFGVGVPLATLLSSTAQGIVSPASSIGLTGRQANLAMGTITYSVGGYPNPNDVRYGVVYGDSGQYTGLLVAIDGSLKFDIVTGKLIKILNNTTAISL